MSNNTDCSATTPLSDPWDLEYKVWDLDRRARDLLQTIQTCHESIKITTAQVLRSRQDSARYSDQYKWVYKIQIELDHEREVERLEKAHHELVKESLAIREEVDFNDGQLLGMIRGVEELIAEVGQRAKAARRSLEEGRSVGDEGRYAKGDVR
ncbi:hypothetical protein Slin14017_G071150 [Septoria linicola]|nr:hypothetical protein Slin14017_G071150 [Septoria linicola]